MAAGIFDLNSTGTLNVDGGTATLAGEVIFGGGAVNFTSGALRFTDPSVNLNVGIGGLLGTSLTLAADRQLTIGGTTTIEAFRTLTLDGGSLATGALVNNGTLDFRRGTLAITGASGLNMGSGPLGSIVTLGSGANLVVSNATSIDPGALLRVDGGSFAGSAVMNNGTLDHRDGALAFSGTFTNNGRMFIGGIAAPAGGIANAGTITMQNRIGLLGGAGALMNTGLVTGDGTIARAVTNAAGGTLRGEMGSTLTLTGSFAANAGTVSLRGGTVEFTTAITNAATGFISGYGDLITRGLTNQGNLAFTGNAGIFGDVTNTGGARIVTSGGATTTFFDDVTHNGTEIRTSAGSSTVILGAATGAGNYTGTGTVFFEGDLRPGNSPATVSFGGNVVLGDSTATMMEIGGLTESVQYDSLHVAGSLNLGGSLALSFINGYVPGIGAMFDLFDAASISGAFDSVTLPALGQYLAWNTAGFYTTGEVSVNSTLTPIQQWRLQNFSDPSNSGDGADNNDFDKDGIANLMEYALGLDPRIPTADGLPLFSLVTVGANQHAALTITRPLGARDVNFRFEVTTNLVSYDPGSFYGPGGDIPTNAFSTEVSRTDDGTTETITVRDNTPLSGAEKRFLRLKVTNPAP